MLLKLFTWFQKKKGGKDCLDLRKNILKSLIKWGLNKDIHYLNLPNCYQTFEQFVRWYLSEISESDHNTTNVKELVNMSIDLSQSWNEMTSRYTLDVLIKETIKWCLKDPVWLTSILKRLDRYYLRDLKSTIVKEAMSDDLCDTQVFQLVKDIYDVQL